MIITDDIREEDFKFCPKCGNEVVKTSTLADRNNSYLLLCTNCKERYYLGLEPDIC